MSVEVRVPLRLLVFFLLLLLLIIITTIMIQYLKLESKCK
jgi:hypothetical protein